MSHNENIDFPVHLATNMNEFNLPDPYTTQRVLRFEAGYEELIDIKIVAEKAVDMTVNGVFWLTFLCTPVLVTELCAGFLFNEGFISSIDEIADIQICKNGENVDLWLTHSVEKPTSWKRTSGCAGGMTSTDAISRSSATWQEMKINPEKVNELISLLYEHQEIYQQAGGVHTSVLTDGGKFILSAEDIGRHNSLDKIAGLYLLEGVVKENLILLTTGRISSEMLQKAARLNTVIVISRTSPTGLSVSLADQLGITLIGYARKNNFNAYTHQERISSSTSSETFPG